MAFLPPMQFNPIPITYANSVAQNSKALVGGGGSGMVEFDNSLLWAQLDQQSSIAKAQLANSLKIAQGNWKVQRESIAAQLKLGMAQIDFQKERMTKLEIPDMESQIRFREHQMMMAEKVYELNRSELGLQVLQFEAQLGGPDNWVQASNFARGVNEGGYAQFVDALLKNQQAGPAFQAPVGQAPTPMSLDTLAAKLGAGQTAGTNQNQTPVAGTTPTGSGTVPGTPASIQNSPTYQGIKQVLLQGAHKLPAGTLESLDPTEIAMMQSVAKDIGLGEEGYMRWLRDYQNSRVGTENPQLA